MIPFQGKFPCMPFAPMGVVILGIPYRIASVNFPFKPAPKRKGAKFTLVLPMALPRSLR